MAANWHREQGNWRPVEEMPAGLKAAFFANADQTAYWVVEKPTKPERAKGRTHRQDASGAYLFDQAGAPLVDEPTLEPVWFVPAVKG